MYDQVRQKSCISLKKWIPYFAGECIQIFLLYYGLCTCGYWKTDFVLIL
jgi:hypothetical protein